MSQHSLALTGACRDAEKICCLRCFSDPRLRREILQSPIRDACDYCDNHGARCVPVSDLGPLVLNGLVRAYTDPAEEERGYDREEGRCVWDGNPKTILEVLQDEAFHERHRDQPAAAQLAQDLLDSTSTAWDRRKGSGSVFGNCRNEVALRAGLCGRQDRGFDSAWDAFRALVLHNARFFDVGPREFSRRRFLALIEGLCRRTIARLPVGTRLWRARIDPLPDRPPEDATALAREVGPAPPPLACASRMSPVGISYMYVAEDAETCRAELAPSENARLWLGAFETTRPLRVVDLAGAHRLRPRSIFDERYKHDERWNWEILTDFAAEIAKPVGGRDEVIDYVPTQILAEYLRVRGNHGIRYRSSRRPGGINVVLFLGPRELESRLAWHDPRFKAGQGAVAPFDTSVRLARFSEFREGSLTIDRNVPPPPPPAPPPQSDPVPDF
jgi:hypothetical protein